MRKNYIKRPDGYLETIRKGITFVRNVTGVSAGNERKDEQIERLKEELKLADAVVIGAGSGLSAAAGYIYSGERFQKYFSDFIEKYHFTDMYTGGFYPFETPQEFWGYWCRYIWINRYAPIPSDLYERVFDLVKDKDYFVITTNVDHCFQRAGFDKKRLFYTQGDYGLFQSEAPAEASAGKTYDNEESIRRMILSEGFEIADDHTLILPEGKKPEMCIPRSLIPYCADDGRLMTTNLRADETFVEDEGWHKASAAYSDFLRRHQNMRVLFLETGVGSNTPVICSLYTRIHDKCFNRQQISAISNRYQQEYRRCA